MAVEDHAGVFNADKIDCIKRHAGIAMITATRRARPPSAAAHRRATELIDAEFGVRHGAGLFYDAGKRWNIRIRAQQRPGNFAQTIDGVGKVKVVGPSKKFLSAPVGMASKSMTIGKNSIGTDAEPRRPAPLLSPELERWIIACIRRIGSIRVAIDRYVSPAGRHPGCRDRLVIAHPLRREGRSRTDQGDAAHAPEPELPAHIFADTCIASSRSMKARSPRLSEMPPSTRCYGCAALFCSAVTSASRRPADPRRRDRAQHDRRSGNLQVQVPPQLRSVTGAKTTPEEAVAAASGMRDRSAQIRSKLPCVNVNREPLGKSAAETITSRAAGALGYAAPLKRTRS